MARVAVCLFGQPRRLSESWKSIDEFLVQPYHADVFFHFWTTKRAGEQWFTLTENQLCGLLDPKDYIAEPQIDFDVSRYTAAHYPPFNLSSFLYSVARCHSLYEEADYDIVIHCRADLWFCRTPKLESVDDASIYLEHRGTSGDQFAYGTPQVMKAFSRCYDAFDDLYDQIGYTHGETFVGRHLQNCGIEIRESDHPFSVIGQVR